MSKGRDFTDKQRAFIAHYLDCLNATEAAKRAGYSKKTAYSIGHDNLKKPEIRAEIDRILRESAMTPEAIAFRLSEMATADMSQYVSWDKDASAYYVDIDALKADGKGYLIKKLSNSREGPTIEFYSAQSAIDTLVRVYGMITQRIEVKEWQEEAVEDIRRGVLTYSAMVRLFDDNLARELFRRAGVPIEESNNE